MRKRIETKYNNKLNEDDFISTGSTLLNLRLTDNPYCGFRKGTIVNIIGDSFAGKTFLLWTIFAEACKNPNFDNYKIRYDEPEEAFKINITKFFGNIARRRVSTQENGGFESSKFIEDFGINLKREVKNPVIYGLDSFDALSSIAEQKRDTGDTGYNLEKPKILTEILRRNVDKIADSKSFLFIISQTRDKLNAMFGSKKTRSGGRALKFYSYHEIWLAVEKTMTKTVRGKKRQIGNNIIINVTKNKENGKLGKITFPILWDYGIDDISSMISFMVEYGGFKKSKGKIKTEWGDFQEKKLIRFIEDEGKEKKLIRMVWKLWLEIENELKENRKKKYY